MKSRSMVGTWQRLRLLALVVALLSLVLAAGAVRADSVEPELMTFASGLQYEPMPRTDGRYIAWHAEDGIKAFDIAQGHTLSVASGGLYSWGTDVDNGVVVWTEIRGARDIRGKRLAAGEILEIGVASSDEYQPVISGRYVAWTMLSDAGESILVRDLSTMAPPVTVGTWKAESGRDIFVSRPFLDDGVLVWSVLDVERTRGPAPSQTRLYVYRVGDSAPRVVMERSNLPLRIYDFNDGLIIYGRDQQTMIYDVRSGEDRAIGGMSEAASSDGRYVFLLEESNIGPRISAYDLATDSSFRIRTVLAEYFRFHNPHARNGFLAVQQGAGRGPATGQQGFSIVGGPLASLLPTAPRADPFYEHCNYFRETGHTLCGRFREFWQRSGGLPVFGYTLTEEFDERSADTGLFYAVQYLERQRFEHHPEHAGTPYEVLLGRLGAEILALQGRDWQSFPKASPSAPHYVAETGQAIAPEFWNYWRSHGLEFGDAGVSYREALALFGHPISPPQMERNADGHTVLTQWFERARFEYHPSNPEPYRVLLGRLGAELLAPRGW